MLILLALTLMALASPMMQFDSLDSFPVCSDDIELLVMFCLCFLGMALVFAHLFKPILIFFRAMLPPVQIFCSPALLISGECGNLVSLLTAPVPLRI